MSITTYEFLSILQAQNHEQPKVETNSADYLGVLEHVRSCIALNHATELGAALNDAAAVQTLKVLMGRHPSSLPAMPREQPKRISWALDMTFLQQS